MHVTKKLDNIQELKEIGELPDIIIMDDISGGVICDGAQNVVQGMVSNPVMWQKSRRNTTDNQKS